MFTEAQWEAIALELFAQNDWQHMPGKGLAPGAPGGCNSWVHALGERWARRSASLSPDPDSGIPRSRAVSAPSRAPESPGLVVQSGDRMGFLTRRRSNGERRAGPQ